MPPRMNDLEWTGRRPELKSQQPESGEAGPVGGTLPHLQLERCAFGREKLMFEATQSVLSQVLQNTAMSRKILVCFLAPRGHTQEKDVAVGDQERPAMQVQVIHLGDVRVVIPVDENRFAT